jgi:uncharacterized RDD family membrane protein YckC
MYNRILAFIIDFLLVAILSSLVMYAMPHGEKYNETLENSTNLRKMISESEEPLSNQDLINISNELTYDSYKYGVLENSITIVIMISYFTLFTYFYHGQTIGKLLVKTQVVSVDGKEPSFIGSLGRSFLITRTFADVITLILVLSMKKPTFVKSYYYIDLVLTVLWISCPIVAIWRQDGRGLHDLVGKTMVLDKRKLPQEEEKIVEAKIEEKKVEKKVEKKETTKKTNKKSNKKK